MGKFSLRGIALPRLDKCPKNPPQKRTEAGVELTAKTKKRRENAHTQTETHCKQLNYQPRTTEYSYRLSTIDYKLSSFYLLSKPWHLGLFALSVAALELRGLR